MRFLQTLLILLFLCGVTITAAFAQQKGPSPTVNTPLSTARPLNADLPEPPFLQQHPFFAGLVQGLNGNWIATKFFNRRLSPPLPERTDAFAGAWIGSIVIVFGPIMLFSMALSLMQRRRMRAVIPERSTARPIDAPISQPAHPKKRWFALKASPKASQETDKLLLPITEADCTAFKKLLTLIQDAWSDADLLRLKQVIGPEYIPTLTEELEANARKHLRNRVDRLKCQAVIPLESWQEGLNDYARVKLTWTACDYLVRANRNPGDADYIVDGDPDTMTESIQEWLFRRPRHGDWILSEIYPGD